MKHATRKNIMLIAKYDSNAMYAWWLMENFWIEIARYASNFGIKTYICYPKISEIPKKILDENIEIIKYDYYLRSMRSLLMLIKILKKNKIRSIYLTDAKYMDYIYLLCRIFGVNRIILHDHTPGDRVSAEWKVKLKKMIHNLYMLSCDHYIGVSRFVKTRIIKNAGVQARKCSYVHNGVRPINAVRTDYANRIFNIKLGARIIVTTGRAVLYKGIDLLIDCAAELKRFKRFDDVYFLHVGDGPDLQLFMNLATRRQVDHTFIFAGYRKDVQYILQSCDVGIQASHGEAFSLSILEYLNAGLVVIVPNIGGNIEAVHDGVNGFLYDHKNRMDLLNKIIFALDNLSNLNSLKRAANSTIRENFDLDRCNRKFIKLLTENRFF